MAKINEINIKINRAIVTKISIELDEEKPTWWITGALISESGKKISEFGMSNSHWDDSKNIEIPVEAQMLGRQLFEVFMPILRKQVDGEFKVLEDGKRK
jgi:hypothetical protein